MVHSCNRDNCPPTNVSGPKTNCIKCGNLCYLKCFGFVACDKINGNDAVKLKIADNCVVYSLLSQFAFVCCTEKTPTNELKQALKLPSTRSTSKTRQAKSNEIIEFEIANDLLSIKDMLTAIKTSNDVNAMELSEIKSVTIETNETLKKGNKQKDTMNHQSPIASFADKLKMNLISRTPKRSLSQMEQDKPGKKLPTPKQGKRDIIIGRPVEPKQPRIPKENKPKFDKAVRVSGLHRDTTVEEMNQFILDYTNVNDKSQFECHKLVKKDADISEFTFVSFKISINDEHFDQFMDPETWPNGNYVREFLSKPTLGDFILSSKSNLSQRDKKRKFAEKNVSKPTETTNQSESVISTPATENH